MTCENCVSWRFDHTKVMASGNELVVGECRIRSTAHNYFPEKFNYEKCGEFSPKPETPTDVTSDRSRCEIALNFIESTSRPPARSASAVWDEYIVQIKRILQGEVEA